MKQYHFTLVLENGKRFEWDGWYKRFQDAKAEGTRVIKKAAKAYKCYYDSISIEEVKEVKHD